MSGKQERYRLITIVTLRKSYIFQKTISQLYIVINVFPLSFSAGGGHILFQENQPNEGAVLQCGRGN